MSLPGLRGACHRAALRADPLALSGSHARIVVTFAPIGCPKISDNVRQLPSLHNRHSPAAPELPSTSSGIGARAGLH